VVHSTLILNADASPVSIVPLSTATWQEAVKLVYIDRAEVIAEYGNLQVHSPSLTMNVPSIIILRDYIKVRRTIKFSKDNVFLRDRYVCMYCGIDCRHDTSQLTMDHVIPRFLGGRTSYDNISSSCYSCNLEKANFMRMTPHIKPYRPTYWQLAAINKSMPITVPHEAWIDYIGWDPILIRINSPVHLFKNG
jgi:5-methylcytosine-specific restriction endonuclease McrA